jgi:hypothetical protein
MRRSVTVVGLAVLCAAVLAGCGSSGSSSGTTTTTTSSQINTSTSTSLASTVENLTVTPAVRSALLAAGAAGHNLPVSDYTKLTPGLTYYAYDPTDGLYWAGAQLQASTSSMQAQIGLQDDGSYNLFTMVPGHAWITYEDGLGNLAGSSCSIVVPTAVRNVWGWSTTTPCGAAPH